MDDENTIKIPEGSSAADEIFRDNGQTAAITPDFDITADKPLSILTCQKPVKMPDGSIVSIRFDIFAEITCEEILVQAKDGK